MIKEIQTGTWPYLFHPQQKTFPSSSRNKCTEVRNRKAGQKCYQPKLGVKKWLYISWSFSLGKRSTAIHYVWKCGWESTKRWMVPYLSHRTLQTVVNLLSRSPLVICLPKNVHRSEILAVYVIIAVSHIFSSLKDELTTLIYECLKRRENNRGW